MSVMTTKAIHSPPSGLPTPGGPVDCPAAWYRADMERSQDWIHGLAPAELDEIDTALRESVTRCKSIIDIGPDSFPLPTLHAKLLAIRDEVMRGRGLAVLRRLPVERYSTEEMARIYFGIGRHLWTLRSQNAAGHVLGHVCDIGHDHHHNAYQRGYAAAGPLGFHTDSVDIVALMCLHPAKTGGDSKIVSSVTVHNEVWKRRPDLAPLLFEPVYRDRRGEIPEGMDPWWIMPVYQWHEGNLFSHYSSVYIRSAQRFREAKRLSDEQLELFDVMEAIANEPDMFLRMPFASGDIQFTNNHHIFHGREAYEDWPEAGRRRHLLRLWICPPEAPPLPPAYAERYGGIEIGNRGGIVVPGSALKAPLTPA
jgi:hypothetical protein